MHPTTTNLSKLTTVLLTLVELTSWAERRLDDQSHDRQHIAEHLTDRMRHLVRDTVPRLPSMGNPARDIEATRDDVHPALVVADEAFYLFEESPEPLTDVAGYLRCGCHGSQREHTCGPLD